MGKLLKSETFDNFLLKDGTIRTFMDFIYSGEVKWDYYDTDEAENMSHERYIPWKEVKENAFGVIKGKRTPLYIQLNLLAPAGLVSEIAGERNEQIVLSMSFSYREKEADIVTGVFRNTFSMDKSLDNAWDEWVIDFLKKNEIVFELL